MRRESKENNGILMGFEDFISSGIILAYLFVFKDISRWNAAVIQQNVFSGLVALEDLYTEYIVEYWN
jgi:hypothetical protein